MNSPTFSDLLMQQDNDFSVTPAFIMPVEFKLTSVCINKNQQRVTRIYTQNDYEQHVNSNGVVIDKSLIVGPERGVIFCNKPHDGACYAHVTVVQDTWQSHTDQRTNKQDEHIFHVTIHLPGPGCKPWHLVTMTRDNVYYRAYKNRSGIWMYSLKDSGQRSRGDFTRGCAAQYATAFVRYVKSLTDQHGGRLSCETSKIHKSNGEGRRRWVKSTRHRRQRKTLRKRSARTRMTNRKTTGGSRVTPSFAALQKAVVATFVSSATWLPRIFSYWSGVDGDRRHVTARRTEYLAHPRLQLARVPDDKSDDLK